LDDPYSRAKPLYIDETIAIREGDEVAALVRARADETHIDPKYGVAQVEKSRWEEAQRYERTTWMQNAWLLNSDRNEYHRERFANYAAIQNMHFQRGIELGCGPFTNVRLILEQCHIEHLHLLDPLLPEYLAHPFCRYRDGKFGGLLHENIQRIPGYIRRPWLTWKIKANDLRIGGVFGRPVNLHHSMIETFVTDEKFDLVVMINVLEHCQDVFAIFEKIDEILVSGGTLIFHDKLYRANEVQMLLQKLHDAGHPLRVDRLVIDRFLGERFTSSMHAEYRVENEFRGLPINYQELYYIGCKKK